MAMIIAIAAVASFALPASPNCTTPISIDSETMSVDKLSTEGWSWSASTHTLTIDGMYQSLAFRAENSIDFENENTDINVVIKGENKIECDCVHCISIITSGNISISGDGTLDIISSATEQFCNAITLDCNKLSIKDVTLKITDTNNDHYGDVLLYLQNFKSADLNNVTLTKSGGKSLIIETNYDNWSKAPESVMTITDCNFSAPSSSEAIDLCNLKSLTIDNTIISAGNCEYQALYFGNILNLTIKNSDINVSSNDYMATCFYNCTVNIQNSKFVSNQIFDEADPGSLLDYKVGIALSDSELYVKDSVVSASGNCCGILSERRNYNAKIASLDPGDEDYEEKLAHYTAVKTNHPFGTPVISFENSDLTVSCAKGFLPVSFVFSEYDIDGGDEDFNINDYMSTLKPSFILNNMKSITTGAMSTAALQGIYSELFSHEFTATPNNNTAIYGITSNGAAPVFNYTTHTFTNGAVLAQFLSKGVFELNGGLLTNSTLVSGSVINKTAGTPTKAGFTFGGWYYDKELTKPVKDGDKYTAGMVLYAKWIAATGDNTEIGAFAAIGVFSILGMGLVIKKRK